MPYAANNTISTDPIIGGVQISGEQYQEALEALKGGKIISIDNGFELKEPPHPPEITQPEPPSFYAIAKTTPWLRMTDEEAVVVRAAMDAAPVRLQEIYKAAQFLQSNDALWPTLHAILAAHLSPGRADELLARES